MWCWNVGSSRPEAPCPRWAPRVSPGAENGLGLSMLCEMVAGCCGSEMLSVGWGGCWCSSKFQDCKIFQMFLFNVAFVGCWRCCIMLYPWVAPLAQVCHWIYIGNTYYIGDSSHLWDHGTRELRFGRRSMQFSSLSLSLWMRMATSSVIWETSWNIVQWFSISFAESNAFGILACFPPS